MALIEKRFAPNGMADLKPMGHQIFTCRQETLGYRLRKDVRKCNKMQLFPALEILLCYWGIGTESNEK
jgi:hypothetical protein